MRGPIWHPDRGVTGEKHDSPRGAYETYIDDHGDTRTRIIDQSHKED